MSHTHAIIPLAVLEAVQQADLPPTDPIGNGFGGESGGTLKFGQSRTVAAQVQRYRDAVDRAQRIPTTEVVDLFRLIGRRTDAAMVFADAGRRAGRLAAERLGTTWKMMYRVRGRSGRTKHGLALVRRAARGVFDIEVDVDQTVRWHDAQGIMAHDGMEQAPDLFGAATAELLRRFASLEGALFLVDRGDGDRPFVWKAEDGR